MTVDGSVRLFAPAKLTTTLRVTGRRADGLHLIDAEMVALDWGDSLQVEPARSTTVELVDVRGQRISAEDTLIRRALELVGISARVVVTKRVPPGAGLGGGSADAAAILRWMGWPTSAAGLAEAATLGADVAFCLVGGRARVGGIGELVEPLAPTDPVPVVTLLTPNVVCSTPVVYARWDEMGGPSGGAGNDLEPAALSAFPEIAEARDALWRAAGLRPRLAGSGGTWFVDRHVDCAGAVRVRALA